MVVEKQSEMLSMNQMMMEKNDNEDEEMGEMIQESKPKEKKGGLFSGLGNMMGFGGGAKSG